MFRITETVKHLILINVVVYFGTLLLIGDPSPEMIYSLVNEMEFNFMDWERYIFAMFYPTSSFFRPYQIISHMFMHADLTHLFFNMFALYMFGTALESVWGMKRFLIYYLITGIGALALYLLVKYVELTYGGALSQAINVPMLGASGAVFGLLAGFGYMFPESRIMLLFPPIPMKAKYFVLIFGAIELFLGISGMSSGVAHFAHVGGAVVGFLLLRYWRNSGKLYK